MQGILIAVIVMISVLACVLLVGSIVIWFRHRWGSARAFHPMYLEGTEFRDELHYRGGYNYCGPNTHAAERYRRGDPPINAVDRCCMRHDREYNVNTASAIAQADANLVQCIEDAPIQSEEEARVGRSIVGMMKGKQTMEDLRIIPRGAARRLE